MFFKVCIFFYKRAFFFWFLLIELVFLITLDLVLFYQIYHNCLSNVSFLLTNLRKKKLNDPMANAGFTFQQCSFLTEFHYLHTFVLPKHPFIHRSNFVPRLPRFIHGFLKVQ